MAKILCVLYDDPVDGFSEVRPVRQCDPVDARLDLTLEVELAVGIPPNIVANQG